MVLGHMVRVPDKARSGSAIGSREDGRTLAYASSALGGFGVSHERSSAQNHINSTKLLVVFNGSSKTQSEKSLNDILHTGAKLQRDIAEVLLWSIQPQFMFMTDITKMFRQIQLHKDEWPLQKILWIDANGQEVTFHLTPVTYGTSPAPILSVRVLLQLAVAPVKYGRYIDDICGEQT